MKKVQKNLLVLLVILVTFLTQKQITYQTQQKIENTERQKVELIRVVDGDTLIIRLNNTKERLRLVGMDAPESVKPHSSVECFGKEASQHIKDILSSASSLEFVLDASQDSRDRFGRLLGYVFADGKNIAEQMIADGYAYEYTYDKNNPYQFQSGFKKAEQNARREKHGLWADEACSL